MINTLAGHTDTRFEALMTRSYKKVYNTVYRLCGHKSDAEDLTQEAFYRAYRSFGNYEGDKPFENWIMRIASRLFLDLLRNRRRRVQTTSYDAPMHKEGCDGQVYFDVPDHHRDPEGELLDSVYSEDLQAALNLLNKQQRLLIQMADIEGLPYQEIAKIMDKPIGTIRSRLHRTHRLLRSHLEAIEREREMGVCENFEPARAYVA